MEPIRTIWNHHHQEGVSTLGFMGFHSANALRGGATASSTLPRAIQSTSSEQFSTKSLSSKHSTHQKRTGAQCLASYFPEIGSSNTVFSVLSTNLVSTNVPESIESLRASCNGTWTAMTEVAMLVMGGGVGSLSRSHGRPFFIRSTRNGPPKPNRSCPPFIIRRLQTN